MAGPPTDFAGSWWNFNAISLWLKEWNDRIPAWLQIEKATSNPHSLPALLCAPLPPLVNNIKDNIIVTQSLRIINQFKRCFGIQSIPISHIREQWENDLGAQLADEEWDMALTRVHSSSICSRHSLIQFKVLHRLHFSKVKLARIFPNPICDRCKQAPATSYHMFWSCPKPNMR